MQGWNPITEANDSDYPANYLKRSERSVERRASRKRDCGDEHKNQQVRYD